MKPWHWLLVAVVVLFTLFYNSRSDFRAFDAQREDWHRRCDAYINAPGPQAADCKRELNELMAYAKRKGWN